MSLFTLTKLKKPAKVHYSHYIRTENEPAAEPITTPEPQEDPKPAAQ